MILDAETASVATGVPLRTIQRWVQKGWLADHTTRGRGITVDVDELQRLAEKRPHGRLVAPSRTVA